MALFDDFSAFDPYPNHKRVSLLDQFGMPLYLGSNKLITGSGEGDSTNRMRVDAGSSHFYNKKTFITHMEFSNEAAADGSGVGAIAVGNCRLIKVTLLANVILLGLKFSHDGGEFRGTTWGGTNAPTIASFPTDLTVIPANRMLNDIPAVASKTSLAMSAGTAYTTGLMNGNTKIDTVRIISTSVGNSVASAGGGQDSERGVPIGTAYILLQNVGSSPLEGIFYGRWEERY